MSEPFFSTHFPRFPVFPGVLIIEAMAQLAGLLIEMTPFPDKKPRKALLSIVEKVKFKRMVRPGDRLDLSAELVVFDEEGARAEVFASVNEAKVASTRLTFVLFEVPPEFSLFLEQEREALLKTLLFDEK